MRLTQMGEHFLAGRERKGLGMCVKVEDGATTLEYTGGSKLATITDRTDTGFRLTIHRNRYGGIAHCNRISAIFQALNNHWTTRRYSAFQRYGSMRLYDNKLRLEVMVNGDILFTVKNGLPSLDYPALERTFSDEKPETTAVANTSTNTCNNSSEAISNLMALVATI